jgi:hypothetical protein
LRFVFKELIWRFEVIYVLKQQSVKICNISPGKQKE